MSEPKSKEGELTDADLAAYGIPPKQPDGSGGEIKEQAEEMTNHPDVEVSGDLAEKPAKL